MNMAMAKPGGPKGERTDTRPALPQGPGLPASSRRIARRVPSIRAVLGERPAAAGKNRLQEDKGPAHRKREPDGPARPPAGETSDPRSNSGPEASQPVITPQAPP